MGSNTENLRLRVTAKDATKKALGGVANSLKGIVGAYIGFKAVTGIIKSVTKAAMEHEKAWNAVAASLVRHGQMVDGNIFKIKKFSGEMQAMSGESDEVIGKMVQSFVDYGQSVEEAMDTARVAMDLAAGGNMNLMAASDLLAKAAVGYTGTLSRYGIIIDESVPKSERFAAAIEQINDRFGGAAQAQAETFDVKLKSMTQSWGDLTEAVGLFITEAKSVGGLFDGIIEGLNAVTEELTDSVSFWDKAVAKFYQVTGQQEKYLEKVSEIVEAELEGRRKIEKAQKARLEIAQQVNADLLIIETQQLAEMELLHLNAEIARGMKLKELTLQLRQETDEELIANVVETNEELQYHADLLFKKLQDNNKKELKAYKDLQQEKKEASAEFARAAGNILNSGVDSMVDAMFDGQQSFQDIFKGMAEDFMKFFIKQGLASIANVFIPGLGALLGGIFDTAKNDRMAMTQGLHFAQYFSKGAMFEFNRFANSVPSALAFNSSAFGSLSLAGVSGGGGGNITINISDSVVEESFVRDKLVPAIESAINSGHTDISIDNSNLTGTPNVRLA